MPRDERGNRPGREGREGQQAARRVQGGRLTHEGSQVGGLGGVILGEGLHLALAALAALLGQEAQVPVAGVLELQRHAGGGKLISEHAAARLPQAGLGPSNRQRSSRLQLRFLLISLSAGRTQGAALPGPRCRHHARRRLLGGPLSG
jgi:hypothetical protein